LKNEGCVQATHTFDVNGCDGLLHYAQEQKLQSYRAPFDMHGRFMRALRQNIKGNIDESLVPQSI